MRAKLGLCLMILTGLFSPAQADDNSSSREGLIKLPTSGGTVQKDESSFSFNSSRGAASYSIPLPSLPSRGGLAPSLSLGYSQLNGDGGSGFGIGWQINASAIAFNEDKGAAITVKRRGNEDFMSSLALDGQRLLPHADNSLDSYRYSLENSPSALAVQYTHEARSVNYLGLHGESLEYAFPGGFIVQYADGKKAYYAENSTSAESDPLRPQHVVRWPLTLEVNPRGEAVIYTYEKRSGRSYLKEVSFAGGQSRYVFELIDTRANSTSFLGSFQQKNTTLYGGVSALFRDDRLEQLCFAYLGRGLGSDNFTVRSGAVCQAEAEKDLAAVTMSGGRSLNILDQLRYVYRLGKGETYNQDNAWPKISFAYSNWNESDISRSIVFKASGLANSGLYGNSFELTDYNLDALLDVFVSDGVNTHIAFGEDSLEKSFSKKIGWTLSREGRTIIPKIGEPEFQFADIDGNSLPDLVEIEAGKMHIYLRKVDGSFAYSKTLAMPFISSQLFSLGSFRFIDINNDGLTDLVGNGSETNGTPLLKIYVNQTLRKSDGSLDYFFLETLRPLPFKPSVTDFLASADTLLSDVNGDRLLDLVRIMVSRGGLCIYENHGDIYGGKAAQLFFAENQDALSKTVCEKGRFVKVEGLDQVLANQSLKVWFLDANGDGILDLTSFNGNDTRMSVWLGFGTGEFLQKPLVFNTDELQGKIGAAGRQTTRIADIDADGQSELVVMQGANFYIVDFNRLADTQMIKSNLLTRIENGSGLRHDIRYVSSIDELLRDRKAQIQTQALHFPMYMVKQVITSEMDPARPGFYKDGREVQELLYHNPIYDAAARKLVGFETVETIGYGDEYLGAATTQQSSYRKETFYTDYRLSGQLKDLVVHEFTPTGSFAEASAETASLSMTDIRLHSLKKYAQNQNLAEPGRLLYSENHLWTLVPSAESYRAKAFFQRKEKESKKTHGASEADVRIVWSAFDIYNIASESQRTRSAIVGPNGVVVPERTTTHKVDYEESRSQLFDAGILNLPSLEEIFVSDAGRPAQKTASSSFSYLGNGLLESSSEQSIDLTNRRPAGLNEPLGRMMSFIYDAFGNTLSRSENGTELDTVRYDKTGTLPVDQQNALGHRTVMFYGSEPVMGCENVPNLTTHEGRLTAYKDPRGVCSYLSYDNFGRRNQLIRDDSYLERYTYKFAEDGSPSFIRRQALRYAPRTPIPARERAWVETMEAYTPAGAKIASFEELEEGPGIRVLSYEEHNRKKNNVRMHTPFQDATTSLDEVFESGVIPTAGKGSFKATSYDGLDRIAKVILPSGRVENYQHEPWGLTLIASYDKGLGRGPREVQKQIVRSGDLTFAQIDERGAVTRFAYDLSNKLSEILLPGQTIPRTYSYDSLGRKLSQCIPAIGCSYFEYDALGYPMIRLNLDSKGQQTGKPVSFHDAIGRLTEVYEGSRLLLRNRYDSYPSGNTGSVMGLLTVSESFDEHDIMSQTKTVFYDHAGRINQKQTQLSDRESPFIETYKYTLDGALQEATDPAGVRSFYTLSPTLRFTRLELELPWKKGSREVVVDKVSYNAKGQIEQIAYCKGSYTSLAYDAKTLFLTDIQSSFKRTDGNTEFLQNAHLNFDGNASIVSIEDLVPANTSYGQVNRSGTFDYNERDELIGFKRYGETQTFAYDDAGNFLQNTELGPDLFDQPQSSLLPRSSEELQYAFNHQGQLQTRSFKGSLASDSSLDDLQRRRQILETRFNSRNQLIYVKTQAQEIFFGYDSEGIRYYKRVRDLSSAATADSLFPAQGFIVEPSGAQSHVFVGSRRVARIEHPRPDQKEGTWYYYLVDHLGSTDFTMHADGTPVEQIVYRAYGSEPLLNEFSEGLRFDQHRKIHQSLLPKERTHHRFTSQYLDDDSGLYYYNARFYDPALGRFISPDPLFAEQPEKCVDSPVQCNLYSYTSNNPMNAIDPKGLETEILIGGPYKDHPYGHAAIRVFGEGYDMTYDFGRYGKTWGFGNSEGEGQLRVWNNAFGKYVNGENSTGRVTKGYEFATTKEQDMKIVQHFSKLIGDIKPNASGSDGKMNQFRLNHDYNALKNNCTTVTIDAASMAIPKVDFSKSSYIQGQGLSFSEKAAARVVGWPNEVFMPADFDQLLSDQINQSVSKVNTYQKGP